MRNNITYLGSAIAMTCSYVIVTSLFIAVGITMFIAMMCKRFLYPEPNQNDEPGPMWYMLGWLALIGCGIAMVAYLQGHYSLAVTGGVIVILTAPVAVYEAFCEAIGGQVVLQGETAFCHETDVAAITGEDAVK
ncbi:MAG: hypothetical protein ACKVOE_05035 [Rickettsiales bacterium]